MIYGISGIICSWIWLQGNSMTLNKVNMVEVGKVFLKKNC